MSESILQRHSRTFQERVGERHDLLARPGAAEDDATDDHGAFGWLRGSRERAVCLELRFKTGSILALSYHWIERFEFDPSEGITLYTQGKRYRLRGRNLNAETRPQVRLFEGLTRHRVPWVRETDRAAAVVTEDAAAVIERIVCE